ncbi:MAG: Thiosulfate sulfurtransferase GlpE [Paracidovorax wautersii]|uniref:Thiosulfate sulfurtransferase GlpE n=1 Tax=Paracidovorax wautersii TaxID=1177982 RepID=A0A7V8JS03_9BURK|nr:MAG: Thiosulfate sulfurtransferase GlpE [Paracidovorax wautersii]
MTTHLDTACVPAVACAQLQTWLTDGDEVALLDVREPGQYGEGHPFFSVNVPYSRLEVAVGALVPRRATRLVLLDGGEPGAGLAVRAAARLQGLGYTAVHRLDGGAAAWAESGRALFKGINVPSKTFGELVEHARHTPSIGAAELQRRLAAHEPLLLVDGRTLAEHRKMTIPGAIPIPNGELAARIASVLPDARTPVVVHCAGRTRSIIGAQILIDLGLPNPVYALENGTQGWRLAGFDLEHGSARQVPPTALDAAGPLREAALARAARQAAPRLTAAQAQAWLDDPGRTTYVLDVRSAAEFAHGTLAGARHAPGGQLLQATDLVIGVRAARVLLLDGDGPQGLRAPVIASWLRQLGFEAATVEHGIHAPLRVPAPVPPALPALAQIAQDNGVLAARLRTPGHVLLDLRLSLDHRRGHAAGARWTLRPRLDTAVEPGTRTATLISDDDTIARLAAIDLREQGVLDLAWTRPADLQAIGHPTDSTPDRPSDLDAIDYLFFVHDRHDGNLDAARRYLEWETGLIAQCQADEIGAFRLS